MQILGYFSYAVLVFLAFGWTIGVRMKKDAEVSTIMGAIVFLVCAALVPALSFPWLYSLGFIVLGFVTPLIVLLIAGAFPPLFQLLRLVTGIFARIIRTGS
jgi:hypothetical protein